MPRDLGIADRLRAEGLTVVEVDGWRTRGSEGFNPRGSVNHHTAGAGPERGVAPSLGICIRGRADLPGPLCNVFLARDNVVYVVAAGRAHHAGTGGWQGLSGNSSVYGLEVENVGTAAEPWRPDQIDVMVRIHRALIRGRAGASMVCQHKEWTRRKIDAHSISGPEFRARVAGSAPAPAPAPPPPRPTPTDTFKEKVMANPVLRQGSTERHYVRILQGLLIAHASDLCGPSSSFVDGDFGPNTTRVLRTWQERTRALTPDGICGPATWAWLVGV